MIGLRHNFKAGRSFKDGMRQSGNSPIPPWITSLSSLFKTTNEFVSIRHSYSPATFFSCPWHSRHWQACGSGREQVSCRFVPEALHTELRVLHASKRFPNNALGGICIELPSSETVLRSLPQEASHFLTVRMCHENVNSQLPINPHEQTDVLIGNRALPYGNAACWVLKELDIYYSGHNMIPAILYGVVGCN